MVDLGKTLKLAWYKNELLSFDRIPIFNDLLVQEIEGLSVKLNE